MFLLKKIIILEIISIYYYQTEIGMKSYLVVAVNCLWGYENFAKKINLYIDRSIETIDFVYGYKLQPPPQLHIYVFRLFFCVFTC